MMTELQEDHQTVDVGALSPVIDHDSWLIETYLEENPLKSGQGNARIRQFGVAVWAIVGYWRAVDCQLDRVARDYHLPAEAVDAALAYYRGHAAAIDERIAANCPARD